jgi:uncharacterized protein
MACYRTTPLILWFVAQFRERKVRTSMAQYAFEHEHEHEQEREHEQVETVVTPVADPIPLGMGTLAFTTALLGCFYAGFIVPSLGPGARIVISTALFFGGIVQILAGMWEFKKANTVAATIFSAYGGFLVALGAIFGALGPIIGAGIFNAAFGLLFLCWTIFTGVLVLGTLRTNMALMLVLLLLFVSYLFLAIGHLAVGTTILLRVGGWLGIVSALVAWYIALADLLEDAHGPVQLPMGWIRYSQRHAAA